jgi:RNA polymerase sigma factor (TIGR02999 family)
MYSGEDRAANGRQLLVLLYHELRVLARQRLSGERPNHTLNTTALVNELYLRVAPAGQHFSTEIEFIAAASQMMRRILVDHARTHNRQKRGGGVDALPLSELTFEIGEHNAVDVEVLDDALTRLARIDPRQARVVEMRFFGGMSETEIAAQLGVSSKTVRRDWATARSWLRSTLAL